MSTCFECDSPQRSEGPNLDRRDILASGSLCRFQSVKIEISLLASAVARRELQLDVGRVKRLTLLCTPRIVDPALSVARSRVAPSMYLPRSSEHFLSERHSWSVPNCPNLATYENLARLRKNLLTHFRPRSEPDSRTNENFSSCS